jgi:hypothetical protein
MPSLRYSVRCDGAPTGTSTTARTTSRKSVNVTVWRPFGAVSVVRYSVGPAPSIWPYS